MVLQQPIAGAKIAPLRLDAPAVKDESLLAVGWGMTPQYTTPPVRQQRAVTVAWVGPPPPSSPYGFLTPEEFATTEGPCYGDSGSPARATSTGAVVGVVSRSLGGGEGELGQVGSCLGADMRTGYSQVAGFKSLIMKGFEAAAAEPWLEGQPNPLLGKSGASCTKNEECLSASCLPAEKKRVCAPPDCKTEACPSGYTCTSGDGGKPVCEAAKENAKDPAEDASCAFSARARARAPAERTDLSFGLLLTLGVFALVRRSR